MIEHDGENPALDSAGAEVVAVTCFDPARPKDNMIDGDERTFSTTGLYPQEVVVKLSGESHVTSVETVTTNAQLIEVKYTDTVTATEWDHLATIELNARGDGSYQYGLEDAPDGGVRATFLKFIIRKGFDDFVTVHMLTVNGEAV